MAHATFSCALDNYLIGQAMRGGRRRDEEMTTETALPTITVEPADHAHHWVLGEPSGPVTTGICKRCGATREFRNWLQEIDFITTDDERRAA